MDLLKSASTEMRFLIEIINHQTKTIGELRDSEKRKDARIRELEAELKARR